MSARAQKNEPTCILIDHDYQINLDLPRHPFYRTSSLVFPNMNRKLFLDVSSAFPSFPLVFRYSRTIFCTPRFRLLRARLW